MHSPHFVELSAYFNALLLGAAVRERQQGEGEGAIFGCGLYKFYFCLAASQKCTLFNGHGLCASQLRAPPRPAATNHGVALSFQQQGKICQRNARRGTRVPKARSTVQRGVINYLNIYREASVA